MGGWIGVGLQATASGIKVKETCREGTEEACRRVRFTESGKFSGIVMGGAAGAAIAGPVCAAIGLSTLGAGGIACGLVLTGLGTAVLGNTFGEWGEQGADVVYEIQK